MVGLSLAPQLEMKFGRPFMARSTEFELIIRCSKRVRQLKYNMDMKPARILVEFPCTVIVTSPLTDLQGLTGKIWLHDVA
jgi:hypothetical protein